MLRSVASILRVRASNKIPGDLEKLRPAGWQSTRKVAPEALGGEHDLKETTGVPPAQLDGRVAWIYKPSPNAMSSGRFKFGQWKLVFKPATTKRWKNPLMVLISYLM